MVKKYSDLYLDARKALLDSAGESAALVARHLLCRASGKTPEQMLRDRELYASEEIDERLSADVARYQAGEPLAYILGELDFAGMTLTITPDVLIPRDDTMAVTELAMKRALFLDQNPRILDLCAGSGCVGLAIAANAPGCRVVLGELAEGALRVCKQNVRRNELNARVTCLSVDAMEPPSSALWDFDVIVSNPPYIPTGDIPGLDPSVRDYEPLIALDGGADGLDFYRFIASKWKNALRLGGTLLFEVGIGQAPEVEEILAQNGFEQIQTTADTQGIWRVVEGTING